MIRRPPRSTRTDTLFPYTTLFRSTVNIFTDPEPPVLTVPAASDDGRFTVSWTSSDGAAQYRLEEQIGSDGWNEIQQAGATSRILSGKASGMFSNRVSACMCSNPESCGIYSAV